MTTPDKAPNGNRKKALITITTVFALAGLGYTAYYKTYAQYHQSTDDAYVGGNQVYVNSQVSGTVIGIDADDNQPVKAGSTLVRLDGTDSAVTLADAEARLAETVRGIRQQYNGVDEASAVVAQRQTDLNRAKDDLARRAPLAGSDALSSEDAAHALDAVSSARAALTVAQKQMESAQTAVAGSTLRSNPTLLRARTAYVQAWLANRRNTIVAPIDGVVARRTVQVGQRVTPENALLAVVPLTNLWVDANYKEAQLSNIRIGQPATIEADVYGSHVEYHGKVAGIAAGTGGAFSLLPPQNATGNWIKVVQRIPVRIALDPQELTASPLRIGLSTTVIIDTHDRGGSVLSTLPTSATPMATTVFAEQLQAANTQADSIIAKAAGSNK
jgi:membrane fusion protein (multidrug efflux system)